MFISNQIERNVRHDLSLGSNDCEDIWIEISISNHDRKNAPEKFVIGNIYRRPRRQYKKFDEKLYATVENLNESKTK